MKKIYLILLTILFVPLTSFLAQTTTLLITNGTSVSVPNGAEICADFITVNYGGTYTADPGGTCPGAIITDVVDVETSIPTEFALYQNYPNPFNPTTTIKYSVPQSEIVSLKLYDILGSEVAVLTNEFKTAGTYSVEFNASRFASRVYFYQIRAGSFVETKKMVLLR